MARNCTRKWLGESERALREVFKKARRTRRVSCSSTQSMPVAAKVRRDRSGTDVYHRILSQLLREIDNLRDVKGVILLAATNRPEQVGARAVAERTLRLYTPVRKTGRADRAAICDFVAGVFRSRPTSISMSLPAG